MSSRRTPTVWSCRGFSCTCWVALDAHLWCPSQSFDKRVIQLLTVVAYMYIWYIYIYIYYYIYIIYPTKHFKVPINTSNQYVNINHWISESSVWSIPPGRGDPGDRHGSSKSFTMRCESSSFRSVSASKGPARSEAVSFGQRWSMESMESMASVAGFPSIAYIICAIICMYIYIYIDTINQAAFQPKVIQRYPVVNLVGGWALPLWKMMDFVSWDDDIPNIWRTKKCSKPPTRYIYILLSCKTHTHLTISYTHYKAKFTEL